MIVHQYVKDFENMGLGMFVHFGVYSTLKLGEWVMHQYNIPREEYRGYAPDFRPEADWAERLVVTAKSAGCRYITLTARHHDGFSLYDTCTLNDYSTAEFIGRDLVREFVDACNRHGIIPFFYHTYLDWYDERFNSDFPAYLAFLRESVKLLCTRYGRIGGIWFDGKWSKKEADWEEDAMYSMIRRYQPEAIIVNNTGLSELGALGHIELDSVTFERGKPKPLNLEGSPKYVASEMCEIFGSHWGYAEGDLLYKSPATIIEELCDCRRYGANMLLNVGPMGNGYISEVDSAFYSAVGKWTSLFGEAIRKPRPSGIEVGSCEGRDFILRDGDVLYLFCFGLPTSADPNAARAKNAQRYEDVFTLNGERVVFAEWLDDHAPVDFEEREEKTVIRTLPYKYGKNYVVRVAKIRVTDV
jgi:alpha-L-fucosidase